jgi:1-acyl-sn-glycerol-3-phosphate acyltransferase
VTGQRTIDLPDGSWPWLHDFARWLGTWIFAAPFRMRVHQRERIPATGAVVVVVNHSSLLDGPMVIGILRRRAVFLVKQEMFTGPLGWALPRIGQLPVRRGMAERMPLLAAVRVLRSGGVVGVFPEGSRGLGDVASAENGAAWLARSGGAVVLPVACRGTRKPDGGRRGFRPKVDILIGDPITPATARGRAGLAVATEQVRGALAELVVELDRLRAGSAPANGRTGSGELR